MTTIPTHLFKGSYELLLAQGEVPDGPHHAAGCGEDEQAGVHAGLACLGDQHDLGPRWNPLLLQNLRKDQVAHEQEAGAALLTMGLIRRRLMLDYVDC